MKFLRHSLFIVWSVLLLSTQALLGLGMAPVTFKNVGACFKPGFEMYAPMFGSMALSSGFIENLRFYNVVAGFDKEGNRLYVKDKAPNNDPIMEVLLILFPSPAGQLTVEGTAATNFGKLCTEEDIATLFNFIYTTRERLATKRAHLPKDLNKMLKEVSDPEKQIETLRNKFNKANIDKLLLNIAKALEQERNNDRELNKELNKKEEKKEEKKVSSSPSFYPNRIIEQILGAFFCHKYGSQQSLKKFLFALSDDIIEKSNIDKIDGLLSVSDVNAILKKVEFIDQNSPSLSLDDIWIILYQNYFSQLLPYTNKQHPISNGNALLYNRENDTLAQKNWTNMFADCVEVTLRHIMNCIFFDYKKRAFNLEKLDTFMEKKDQQYIKNLKDFYTEQTPELANTGDLQIRSSWNKVVADLGGNIKFRRKYTEFDQQNNNEIDSGMLNFVRVFEKIFNLDLGNEPLFEENKKEEFIEEIQTRVDSCLKTLFESLCPSEITCNISFSDIKCVSISQTPDLIGNINLSIIEKQTEYPLFSFTIRVLNGHIDIQNLQINQTDQHPPRRNLYLHLTHSINTLNKIPFSASFFLDNELSNQLLQFNQDLMLPLYQIMRISLQDITGKLNALDVYHDLYEKIDGKQIKPIIINIMKDYLWHDSFSVGMMSDKLFGFDTHKTFSFVFDDEVAQKEEKKEWDNQYFIDSISEFIEGFYINDYSKTDSFDFFNYPQLKFLFIKDKNIDDLEEIIASLTKLKELNLFGLSLKTLDFSPLKELNFVHIFDCNTPELTGMSDSLKTLQLTYAKIGTLNISECHALETIKIDQDTDGLYEGDPTSIESIIISKELSPELRDVLTPTSSKKITIAENE